jgi:hypothetical protein
MCKAQCTFMPFVQGRVLKYDLFNAQNKNTGSVTYTFKEVSTGSNNTNALVLVENFDAKGKLINSNEVKYTCNQNTFSIDMQSNLNPNTLSAYKDMTIQGETSYLDFPVSAAAGTVLNDAILFLRVYDKSQKEFATIQSTVTNRKVLDIENISTPSDSYSCMKISSNSSLLVKTLGLGIPIETSSVEWWSAGVGLIKSETYNKSGKIISTMILKEVK